MIKPYTSSLNRIREIKEDKSIKAAPAATGRRYAAFF